MRDYHIVQAYYHRPGKPRNRRSRLATAIATVFLALFAAGGIFFGCIFFSTVSDLLATDPSAPRPAIPFVSNVVKSVSPVRATTTPGDAAAPGAAAVATPEVDPFAGVAPWTSSDRITVLLMGLDQRAADRGTPTRSDTMILLTVDPVKKTAGMLSIPRDLWVPIPGHGENKINTAHFFGEADKAGGGPALAKKTVEYNFGVRVNYYARVDFKGFEDLIDAVGGVTIDAERPIKDDEYPASDDAEGGIIRFYIPSGLQHLSGRDALRYARSRHADSDFGRNQRQQAVILAARQQVLQPATLAKVPQMLGILNRSLQTDVPLTDLLPLFNATRGIQAKDIVSRSIDSSVSIDVNGDGTVFVPDRKKIRPLMEEVFGDASTTPAAPVASVATPRPTARPTVAAPVPTSTPTVARTATPAASGAISVYNGTMKERLAATVSDALHAKGYTIKSTGQAKRSDYTETVIQDHTGKAGLANAIARQLGVPTSAVRRVAASTDGADVTVILGLDAKVP